MLYEGLQRLRVMNIGVTFHLIFHTSILNFEENDLEKTAEEIPYLWYFPRDVYYELQLLQSSKIYGEKCRRILQLWKKRGGEQKGMRLGVFLEDFYHEQTNLTGLASSREEKFIFVFGSQLKLKEFLIYTPDRSNYYVYFHNRWSCEGDSYGSDIWPMAEARKMIAYLDCTRKRKKMEQSVDSQEVNVGDCIEIRNKDVIRTGKLKRFGGGRNSGGEGIIFGIEGNDRIAIKIFKKKVSDNKMKKINYLMGLRNRMENAALPEALVYLNGEVIGMAMRKVEGRPLYRSFEECADTVDQVVENLALTLLELNLSHILVADLAADNLLLAHNRRQVYLIDTDSFQYAYYEAGVGMKTEYRHRELKLGDGSHLYEYRHQDFAFSVLMFKFLVSGEYEPLYQYSEEKEEWSWDQDSFPYEGDEQQVSKKIRNKTLREGWWNLPGAFREAFIDVFGFKRDYSIGAWLYLCNRYFGR